MQTGRRHAGREAGRRAGRQANRRVGRQNNSKKGPMSAQSQKTEFLVFKSMVLRLRLELEIFQIFWPGLSRAELG